MRTLKPELANPDDSLRKDLDALREELKLIRVLLALEVDSLRELRGHRGQLIETWAALTETRASPPAISMRLKQFP
jgi:hypothetical protein